MLDPLLADKIFANFSVFQSLPDVWGIDQLFPVLPLTNLHKPLNRRGIIQDITCDSDGRIDRYVESEGVEATLSLPAVSSARQLLGMFLAGAYQEILGDQHNLFGDTNSVDVYIGSEGDITLKHEILGSSVADVLCYVNYEPDSLFGRLAERIHAADISPELGQSYLDTLKLGLQSYTYFAV